MVHRILVALFRACVADVGAYPTDLLRRRTAAAHHLGGESTCRRAVQVEPDAIGQLGLGFADAGGRAMTTGQGACVAGIDTGLEFLVHECFPPPNGSAAVSVHQESRGAMLVSRVSSTWARKAGELAHELPELQARPDPRARARGLPAGGRTPGVRRLLHARGRHAPDRARTGERRPRCAQAKPPVVDDRTQPKASALSGLRSACAHHGGRQRGDARVRHAGAVYRGVPWPQKFVERSAVDHALCVAKPNASPSFEHIVVRRDVPRAISRPARV